VVEPVLSRALTYWHNVDADLGARIAAKLGVTEAASSAA
jgi:hypothetical protein